MISLVLSPTIDVNITLSTATQLIQLPVPFGKNYRVVMNVRVYNPSASPNVYLRHPDSSNRSPSWSAAPLGIGIGASNTSLMHGYTVITDKQGRIAASALSPNTSCLLSVISWDPVDLAQRMAITTELIASGGRIDAVADFNGTLVAATRPGTSAAAQGKVYSCAGGSWAFVTQLTNSQGITCLFPGVGDQGFALGHTSDLWETLDNGATWGSPVRVSTRTAPPNLALSYSGTVLSSGTILIANSAGYISRKEASSIYFTEIFVDAGGVYRLMKVADGVICNTWSGKIYKSFDADDGAVWSLQATLSSGPLYAIEYSGDGRVLIGSASGKVYESFSNGDAGTFSQIQALDGEADDFCSFGGVDLYSVYTSQKSIYLRTDGEGFRSMASLPNGDWLDHAIATTINGEPVAVGGTSQGYIATISMADPS